jgi:hypothetical protein
MKQLLIAVVVTIALTAAAAGRTPTNAEHPCVLPGVWGDANDDGTVTATDALLTLRAAVGLEIHSACGPYDVDCDHDIDAIDALKIVRYTAGLKYSQVEPCPDIGIKPADP